MKNKKAIIFTLDSTIAIIMTLSLIIASLFYLSQSTVSSENENLYRITVDSLAILEKDNVLKLAASTNTTTPLQTFLDTLPYNICSRLEIFTKDNTKLLTAVKRDCTYSEDYLVSRRVFIVQGNIFIAKMEAWYK